MIRKHRAMLPVTLGLAIANLTVYILFHISYNLIFNTVGIAVEYIFRFAELIHNLLMPAVLAASYVTAKERLSSGAAAVALIPPTLTRALFCLPYYYIYFISSGYSTEESIPMSLGVSTVAVLLTYAEAMLAVLAVKLICDKKGVKGGAVDGEEQISRRIGVISVCAAILVALAEIPDTVRFFIEYGTDFSSGEVVFIMLRYVCIIAFAAVCLPMLRKLKIRLSESFDRQTVEIID